MTFLGKFSNRNKNDEESSNPWREKYLNLLDKQDQLEQAHKEDQNLLCSVIARLAIVASGFDPQLEPNLQRIRQSIKAGLNSIELKLELDSISEALTNYKATPLVEWSTAAPAFKQAVQAGDPALLFAFLRQRYPMEGQQQLLVDLQNSPDTWLDEEMLFSSINKILANEPIAVSESLTSTPDRVAPSNHKKSQNILLIFLIKWTFLRH